jgi:hypothetical protein
MMDSNVPAHITHFGKLGGLHFDERRVGQIGQTSGDFRFAYARGADHQNILGGDLVAQLFGNLHSPPAITQGNGDGALGVILANDMFIQFLDDFSRGHFGHK